MTWALLEPVVTKVLVGMLFSFVTWRFTKLAPLLKTNSWVMVESSSMHSVPEVISGSLECRVLDKVPGDGQGVDSEGRDGTVVDRVLQPFFSIKSVASLVSPPGPCG